MLPEDHTDKWAGIYPLLSRYLSLELCMNEEMDEEPEHIFSDISIEGRFREQSS